MDWGILQEKTAHGGQAPKKSMIDFDKLTDTPEAAQYGFIKEYKPYCSPWAVDSKKLELGPGTIYAGVPSSLGFGDGGQSSSNFLASTAVGSRLYSNSPCFCWQLLG